MRFNFDEIDDIALAVVRADMARIYNEPLQKHAQPAPVSIEETSSRLPMFLRPQAE